MIENTHKTNQMPLRIPTSLHQELKEEAAREGLSLNQYCLYILSRHQNQSLLAKRHRAEDLLRFLTEAQALEQELTKSAPRPLLSREEVPKETPLSRWKKLYGKN